MVENFDIHSENKIHFIEPENRRDFSERLDSERRIITKVDSCSNCRNSLDDRCSDCGRAIMTSDKERNLITVYIGGESILEADVPASPSPAHGIVVDKLYLVIEGHFLSRRLEGTPFQIRLE